MNKIISLQGPWATGKSSLIKALTNDITLDCSGFKEFGNEEREQRDKINLDLSKKTDFIKNQEIFFKGELSRYEKIKKLSSKLVILDRGPEDTICFSRIHPRAINASWNIDKEINHFIDKYICYSSNIIIYLYADIDVLIKRKENDFTKIRRNHGKYLSLYYELEKKNFSQLPNSIMIDTTNISKTKVFEIVKEYL